MVDTATCLAFPGPPLQRLELAEDGEQRMKEAVAAANARAEAAAIKVCEARVTCTAAMQAYSPLQEAMLHFLCSTHAMLFVQVAGYRSQAATLEGDLKRVQSRHEAEKQALSSQARADVFAKLLPLLDNFERAAQSLPNKTQKEGAIHDQYQAIYKQMQELLK